MPNAKKINWEKLSIYLACLGFLLTFWGFLNQTNRDIADIRERIKGLEVKTEFLLKAKNE